MICMPVSIHIHSASQQHLFIALTTLSTIKIHMFRYKYNREAFLQFPTLAGESPKWNMLVVTWGTCDFPEIYTQARGAQPQCECVYSRQITCAHVTTSTYTYICMYIINIYTYSSTFTCWIKRNISLNAM